MRSRGSSERIAVKCPKCGVAIPLATTSRPPRPIVPPSPGSTDADLRRMLARAKKRRTTDITNTADSPDRTVPDLKALRDDTEPEHAADLGARTMPMGRSALTARDLGTDGGDDRLGASTIRKRLDTPRAVAIVPALRPPLPPAAIERPVVDEPTYTGPMPGRAPHITPSGSDLSRFLEPGNYFVRVEDSVYEPVSEKDLVRLLNAGVFFAIDELRPDGGDWQPISSPELFSDLKGRLAHRAHHMLARVAPPRPASEFGRPAPDEPPAVEPATPKIIIHEQATIPDPAPAPPPKKRSAARLVALVVVPLALLATVVGVALLLMPRQPSWTLVWDGDVGFDEVDAAGLSVLAAEDAGEFDPVPAFQSAVAAINSAHAVADSIDGLLNVAKESRDERAILTLSFEKWKRQPTSVEPDALIAGLMKRQSWQAARAVANWSVATRGDSKELQSVIDTSLRQQFESEAPTEVTAKKFTRLVRIDPGKRPSFVVEDKAGQQWTIWPDLGDDEWRNDIAAYRLCQLIVCHFRIPETREMLMDKATLQALAAAGRDDTQDMVGRMKGDFDWDKDGVLHGSIRMVPKGAPWPIEISQIWRPWLTAGSGLAQLDASVEPAHQQVAFFGADRVYPEIHGLHARQLARQVSSILLVDYLVNNWNRFAPTEEDWGSRTRIDDGLISSVQDSAAFFSGESVRVRGRFSWSKRFSRATVESLKKLDRKVAEEFLFPNASKDELGRIDDLWTQRTRALRRIEKLVKKYGADDVYALDERPKESNR